MYVYNRCYHRSIILVRHWALTFRATHIMLILLSWLNHSKLFQIDPIVVVVILLIIIFCFGSYETLYYFISYFKITNVSTKAKTLKDTSNKMDAFIHIWIVHMPSGLLAISILAHFCWVRAATQNSHSLHLGQMIAQLILKS